MRTMLIAALVLCVFILVVAAILVAKAIERRWGGGP